MGLLNMQPDTLPCLPRDADSPRVLSIVVPVLNEEEALPLFAARMRPILAQVRDLIGPGAETEIVFVDDGSTDRTASMIASLDMGKSTVRLVRLSRNFGKDVALSAGLDHAMGNAVVPMDVDLQDPPELLVEMVAAWNKGARIVNAVRIDRASDIWLKRASSQAFYKVYNRLSSHPVTPNVGDFRLLDRQVVEAVRRMPERVRFMKGLFSWVGYEAAVVEYSRPPRAAGTTKWGGWSLWNFALDGITGSSTLPLRIWSYVGGLVALGAVVYALILTVRTLLYGNTVPGYTSLMVSLMVFSGLNMIALGILGEYIGRIAVEVRARPLYVVSDVITADPAPAPSVAKPALRAPAKREEQAGA
jgi:glycosyltransferase involved in cell wall biosynthesis